MRKTLISLTGPAFVAAVAYVDPGNVAANISAGSHYGYLLVWVLVVANLMAMFIQYHSAKLGLVTHRPAGNHGRACSSRRARLGMWAQAELIAAATDLAEVIGGAIALQLLFNLPCSRARSSSARSPSFSHLPEEEPVVRGACHRPAPGHLHRLPCRPRHRPAPRRGRRPHPRLEGKDSILLAASMLGATVMPHAIYLHSPDQAALPRPGNPHVLAGTRADIAVALSIAGLVNVGLLVLAGSASTAWTAQRPSPGPTRRLPATRPAGRRSLRHRPAGQRPRLDVSGRLRRLRNHGRPASHQGPLLVRRLVTLIPALVIIGCGVDPTMALVVSQALLSLGIPFAIIPLFRYAGSRDVMGEFAAKPWSMAVGWTLAALVIALNLALVLLLPLL